MHTYNLTYQAGLALPPASNPCREILPRLPKPPLPPHLLPLLFIVPWWKVISTFSHSNHNQHFLTLSSRSRSTFKWKRLQYQTHINEFISREQCARIHFYCSINFLCRTDGEYFCNVFLDLANVFQEDFFDSVPIFSSSRIKRAYGIKKRAFYNLIL